MSEFDKDNQFSKHKDMLLKDYWGTLAFEGRFVLTGSEFLQKTHGIDVIVQTNNDQSDMKIDTKHVRGNYQKLCIEEMSCTIKGREKLGWLLKEDGHPDYIIHVMNPKCHKCYKDCFSCDIDVRRFMVGYISHFENLRNWYMKNKDQFSLCFTDQINRTSYRNVPVKELIENKITKVCRFR